MQAGNLYMYCLHNPVRWTDPSGRVIKLAGTEEEMQEILYYLQSLTDDVLGVTPGGVVYISRMATSNIQFPNGNTLLRRMIASTHVVTIHLTTGDTRNVFGLATADDLAAATTPGVGTGGIISFNPSIRAYTYTALGRGGLSSLTRMPANIILVHELIHADRAMRGAMIPLDQVADNTIRAVGSEPGSLHYVTTRRLMLEEWATVGLGHNVAFDITENMIRREHGLRKRTCLKGEIR